jgi:putative ABC transport system ATP-binding protein
VVSGHDLSTLDEDGLARVRGAEIGIVFQSFHLVPTMTALENVALPLEFAGRSDAEAVARELLVEVGLGHRTHHFPAEMSGGEQQRVAIARALSGRPKLLLADEPTGNLDGRTGQQVIDLLFGLQQRHGATLVLVTHDAELAGLCQRTVRMADGQIVGDTANRTGTDPQLRTATQPGAATA